MDCAPVPALECGGAGGGPCREIIKDTEVKVGVVEVLLMRKEHILMMLVVMLVMMTEESIQRIHERIVERIMERIVAREESSEEIEGV